jgi:hypothetical protein
LDSIVRFRLSATEEIAKVQASKRVTKARSKVGEQVGSKPSKSNVLSSQNLMEASVMPAKKRLFREGNAKRQDPKKPIVNGMKELFKAVAATRPTLVWSMS